MIGGAAGSARFGPSDSEAGPSQVFVLQQQHASREATGATEKKNIKRSRMAAFIRISYVFGIISCLVLFLILNFTLGAPAEYCYGSDNCAINCVPSTADNVLLSMCCEEHCGALNPGTLTCIQTYRTPTSASSTCTCMESLQCNYAADSRFSNLSLVFLLLAMVLTHNLLNVRSDKSSAGMQSAV